MSEEEIRNILNKPYLVFKTNKKVEKYIQPLIEYINLQKELIEILDNRNIR